MITPSLNSTFIRIYTGEQLLFLYDHDPKSSKNTLKKSSFFGTGISVLNKTIWQTVSDYLPKQRVSSLAATG